ncbi:uncharacterized protein LOC101837884 [Mesocricetus auratus]|uniref:Uncharacterized protein LOC101837884 n=1 Tax=Mesocricetus auratus TaxID=10036 RepID=A0ABM2XUA9_MESAU|nr:uncharacterized protein LOC101837884 [Mesocricetus auratus]XP_040606268.1 uncharacterized protein LOC101837884 [Mesocricetus auratus]
MAEEISWRDLSDANVQAVSRSLHLMWSITTLVKTVCSLSDLEENNCETPGTKTFYEGLAQNDMLYERKSNYRIGLIENHRKSRSTKRPAHRLTLPRFPLKRRWSELALPTFFTTSPQRPSNKGQESDCLKTVRVSEETENAVSFGETPEAEIEETITFSTTTLDLLGVLADRKCEMNHEPHDDATIMKNEASADLSDLISQMTRDLTCAVSHSQHGNIRCEIVNDIMSMALPSPSPNEELQEAPIASNRQSRRSWKGVRRQRRNTFRSLCCCFVTPSTNSTTSRVEDEAEIRGP